MSYWSQTCFRVWDMTTLESLNFSFILYLYIRLVDILYFTSLIIDYFSWTLFLMFFSYILLLLQFKLISWYTWTLIFYFDFDFLLSIFFDFILFYFTFILGMMKRHITAVTWHDVIGLESRRRGWKNNIKIHVNSMFIS